MATDLLRTRRDQVFPKLTAQQIARLESHGTRFDVAAGQILAETGDIQRRLLVVLAGSIDVLLPASTGEEIVYILRSGDFAGEMSTLRGVAGFVRLRVRDPGVVFALDQDSLRDVVQTDAELSELMMRAFILRRMALLASQHGEVTLLGSRHSTGTLRVREFLARNAFPYMSVDLDSDPDARVWMDRYRVGPHDLPLLIGRGGEALRSSSLHEVARFLQMNREVPADQLHDVVVIGAGPAGLAAAVYAASEGLDVRVIEDFAPGGQAGSSSRIENYLGFPTGISGQALAGRALVQAQKFGAVVSIASTAVRLHCEEHPYAVELADGTRAHAHAVVIATGARY